MNIVVTGEIGVGKTTLCQKTADLSKRLGLSCGGVLSYKAADRGIMVVDVRTDRMERLASVGPIYDGPRVGKFSFSPEAIDFGNSAIDLGAGCNVLFVDELGPLEIAGKGFVKALELLRKGKAQRSVTVIRRELLPALSAQLGQRPVVVEVTSRNRNELPRKLCSLLLDNGQGALGDCLAARSALGTPVRMR